MRYMRPQHKWWDYLRCRCGQPGCYSYKEGARGIKRDSTGKVINR